MSVGSYQISCCAEGGGEPGCRNSDDSHSSLVTAGCNPCNEWFGAEIDFQLASRSFCPSPRAPCLVHHLTLEIICHYSKEDYLWHYHALEQTSWKPQVNGLCGKLCLLKHIQLFSHSRTCIHRPFSWVCFQEWSKSADSQATQEGAFSQMSFLGWDFQCGLPDKYSIMLLVSIKGEDLDSVSVILCHSQSTHHRYLLFVWFHWSR